MEYIVSRKKVHNSIKDLENALFYNMWQKRFIPYKKLLSGDVLYWYETDTKIIQWRSKATSIFMFDYKIKSEVVKKLKSKYGALFDENEEYFIKSTSKGFCIAYQVKDIEKVNIKNKSNLQMQQCAWLELDKYKKYDWLGKKEEIEEPTFDDEMNDKSDVLENLEKLNDAMKNVNPERVERIISIITRRDSKIVKKLKEAVNYRCQFPGCQTQIKTQKGELYVEVAHIKAVKKGGKSVLGNLLVLCPNHHKEFDLGYKRITNQTLNKISGILNGKKFDIELKIAT